MMQGGTWCSGTPSLGTNEVVSGCSLCWFKLGGECKWRNGLYSGV